MRTLTLVTGPSRSGKSEWAEHLAQMSGSSVVYVATSQIQADDQDWQGRVKAHRQRRPATWQTLEAPRDLGAAVGQISPGTTVLIDSLGTWVANWIEAPEAEWQQATQAFQQQLLATVNPVVVVAEETGWGVVPAYALGRTFRDRLGTLTRQVGAIADPVYLVVAGYALDLKRQGIPVPPFNPP
jgi:adenosylcobinamide kinase/adenosylcobinamide-phosphate guanylyltransferase